ncbi:MAG TPA: copper resistance CopC family protein [Cellulomonas sp.]|uniref:copper resistance CopC family protein n=1 Tax=Cellulomonas sp. TaxID=40001 RepID=UPI002E3378D8|nr:copper resistance CopC family protein [Cellulomonas sp.]HEX5331196.1 copper resistance CopC family protein [Cellulomonas sp.]
MSAATASRRAVVIFAVAAIAVLVGAGAAQAHNTLVSTDPVDGSTVATAPAHVTLTFNEPARSLGTQIVVRAPDGRMVSTGDPVLDGATVSQGVAGALPAGTYTVTWRVTSADGHPLQGVLSFTAAAATTAGAGPAATPAPTATSTPTPTPSTAAPSATASIGPVARAGGTEIGPVVTDQDADGDDWSLSALAVAGMAALVLVLVVVGALLLRRRRAHALRSRSARA